MPDDYDFKLIETFPGYNSSSDPTKLNPGFLIRGSKNIYKTLRGTLEARPGLLRRGVADNTSAGVDSSYEWETSVGTDRVLRVSNGKLQVESDLVLGGTPVWYDLLETSTLASPAATYSRFIFDPWWDNNEKSDRLLMVRGDNNMLHWSGGMAVVESVGANVSGAIFTIALASGGGSYNVGDILTIATGGVNATVQVVTANGSGVILTFTVLTVGSGYSTGSGVAVSSVTTSTGGVSSGAGATFDISAVTTYTPITKVGTDTWAEVGFATNLASEKKIMVNGVESAYFFGEDTRTIYVYPQTATIVAGNVAIQSVLVEANLPVSGFDADFLLVVNNQAWVGSYSSRVIYISADVALSSTATPGCFNFTNTTGLVVGDPDAVILDSPARGAGVRGGKVVVFSGVSDMYLITPNFDLPVSQAASPVTGGNARNVIQKVEKRRLPGLQAAKGQEFIGNFGDYLIWLDQDNQLRALGAFASVDAIEPVHLSLAVEDELREDDFTGGHLRAIGNRVHITAPNTGRDWMYNVRQTLDDKGQVVTEKFWDSPQVRGLARLAIIDGETFGHSNVYPQVYQLWDTNQWHDDDPTDEPIPYTVAARFSYQQHKRRQGLLTFSGVFIEGYMPEGTPLTLNVRMDYQGSTFLDTKIVSDEDTDPEYYLGQQYASLGDSPLGDNPLGEGIIEEPNDHALIPKFRVIVPIKAKKFFEYSLELFSTEGDARWEIVCLGPNVIETSEQSTAIKIKSS